jgi:hypothetical protein
MLSLGPRNKQDRIQCEEIIALSQQCAGKTIKGGVSLSSAPEGIFLVWIMECSEAPNNANYSTHQLC